jgi:hypothetical protein
MFRKLMLLTTFLAASAAQAAWWPVFSDTYVQMRPGEQRTISVHAAWLSGISVVPFVPMTFGSDDEAVATVTGGVQSVATPGSVTIFAHRNGIARIRLISPDYGGSLLAGPHVHISVAGEPLPIHIAATPDRVVGRPITLTAISDDPTANFIWYWGPFGETKYQVGTSPELVVVPQFSGTTSYWLSAFTSAGAGVAAIDLVIPEPGPPRRRSTRH